MRRSSFQKLDAENASVDVMLSRKITSQYDSVKVVEDRLAEIVAVAEALPQVVLAVQSAIDANESELAAQEAADLASRYATEDFNVPVVVGEYSAKHWAQVAETAAGTGVIDDLVTNTSRTWSSSKLVNSFEPIDNTIVKDADIGISVQPYNASTVVDSAYVHTDANYTTLEKTKLSGIASGAQVNTVNSVAGKTGTVTLVKGDVGLGLVDNTADISKVVASAGKLTTARNIALSGDVSGTVAFNGSANVTTTLTLASSGAVAGTYTKVAVDAKGRVTSGSALIAADIPVLDASKIASGTIDAARLPSYVDDVLEFTNLATFPEVGTAGKIYIALDTNKTYRYSGSSYVYITSGAVDSVAGKTGIVTLVKDDVGLGFVDNTADTTKNVLSATKLTTARTITLAGDATGSVSFDGSSNASINVTVVNDSHTHTFANVTGRPTTVSGYGITDAYTKSEMITELSNKLSQSNGVIDLGNITEVVS